MSRPQQPEIRRSQRGRLEQESWRRRQEAEGRPHADPPPAQVPEGNRPGRRHTWNCANCGFDVSQGEQTCPRCGATIPSE
jgi:rubrerythrin